MACWRSEARNHTSEKDQSALSDPAPTVQLRNWAHEFAAGVVSDADDAVTVNLGQSELANIAYQPGGNGSRRR